VTLFSCDDSAIYYIVLVLWITLCFHIIGQNKSDDVTFGQVLQVVIMQHAWGAKFELPCLKLKCNKHVYTDFLWSLMFG